MGTVSVGASVAGTPSRLDLIDSAVRLTRPPEIDPTLGGAGCVATLGGLLNARRVLVARATEGGVMAGGTGSVVNMADVLIADISPEISRGGFGVALSGGSRASLLRLGVSRTRGAALAAVAQSNVGGSQAGSRITLQDGIIQDVAPSSIDYDLDDPSRVTGQPRAYGAYVGLASEMELQRVVMLGGAVGAAAYGGTLAWTDGVASRFSQHFVRGTTVGTPLLRLMNVVVPGAGSVAVQGDPSSAASFSPPNFMSLAPLGP